MPQITELKLKPRSSSKIQTFEINSYFPSCLRVLLFNSSVISLSLTVLFRGRQGVKNNSSKRTVR